ncbi:hypothetical protein HK104_000147 [Borealophlyctis nickersoniae]|nr:hypothetical protein HK104_000147 [Borealophlyctis nickersoniae]
MDDRAGQLSPNRPGDLFAQLVANQNHRTNHDPASAYTPEASAADLESFTEPGGGLDDDIVQVEGDGAGTILGEGTLNNTDHVNGYGADGADVGGTSRTEEQNSLNLSDGDDAELLQMLGPLLNPGGCSASEPESSMLDANGVDQRTEEWSNHGGSSAWDGDDCADLSWLSSGTRGGTELQGPGGVPITNPLGGSWMGGRGDIAGSGSRPAPKVGEAYDKNGSPNTVPCGGMMVSYAPDGIQPEPQNFGSTLPLNPAPTSRWGGERDIGGLDCLGGSGGGDYQPMRYSSVREDSTLSPPMLQILSEVSKPHTGSHSSSWCNSQSPREGFQNGRAFGAVPASSFLNVSRAHSGSDSGVVDLTDAEDDDLQVIETVEAPGCLKRKACPRQKVGRDPKRLNTNQDAIPSYHPSPSRQPPFQPPYFSSMQPSLGPRNTDGFPAYSGNPSNTSIPNVQIFSQIPGRCFQQASMQSYPPSFSTPPRTIHSFAQKAIKDEVVYIDDDSPERPSSDCIDLTEIDSDEEAEMQKVAKREREENETVCYGQIQSFVDLDREKYRDAAASAGREMQVWLVPELGNLKAETGAALSPLQQRFRIQYSATIPKAQTNVYSAPISIMMYGPRSAAMAIGNHLRAAKIGLGPITKQVGVKYYNPHLMGSQPGVCRVGAGGWSSSVCAQDVAVVDEVKSHIEAVYDSIRSAEDLEEAEPDSRLISKLYKHQRQALHFMMEREALVNYNDPTAGGTLWRKDGRGSYTNVITTETVWDPPAQCRGGILADDMGLGKTLELISLVLKSQPPGPVHPPPPPRPPPATPPDPYHFLPGRQPKQPRIPPLPSADTPGGTIPSRATLIVCPLSTVGNWEDQIVSHVGEGKLQVYVYHGGGREKDAKTLAKYDVVITTYNLLSLEYGKDQKARESQRNPDLCTSVLQQVYWFRIVLDEAHIIKEPSTAQAKAACALKAERRWCLTLIKFLGLTPFHDKHTFNHYILKPIKQNAPAGVERLQILMKLLTLRRTKHQTLGGKPILDLPKRSDRRVFLTLSERERTIYDQARAVAKDVFLKMKQQGIVFKNYVHLLELILRLRQLATHTQLVKDFDKQIQNLAHHISDKQDDDMPPLTQARAAHLYSLLKDAGDDQCCMCNSVLEGGEKIPVVSRCGHPFCNDCVGKAFRREQSLACPMCQGTLGKRDLMEIRDGDAMQDMDQARTAGATNDGGVPSTKVDWLLRDLLEVQQETLEKGGPLVKSVVFSQWTSMLDLLEAPLNRAGIANVRLDGKMTRLDRQSSMHKFKADPNVLVMLVSLKAGGVGLNLTMASRVYILEPYWNPAVEQQAIDRIHRLGQTRPVTAIRLIVQNTVEQNIVAMQEKKTAIAKQAFRESHSSIDGADEEWEDHRKGKGKKARMSLTEKEALKRARVADLGAMFL